MKNKACQTYDFIEVKTISQAWLPLFTGYMQKKYHFLQLLFKSLARYGMLLLLYLGVLHLYS